MLDTWLHSGWNKFSKFLGNLQFANCIKFALKAMDTIINSSFSYFTYLRININKVRSNLFIYTWKWGSTTSQVTVMKPSIIMWSYRLGIRWDWISVPLRTSKQWVVAFSKIWDTKKHQYTQYSWHYNGAIPRIHYI